MSGLPGCSRSTLPILFDISLEEFQQNVFQSPHLRRASIDPGTTKVVRAESSRSAFALHFLDKGHPWNKSIRQTFVTQWKHKCRESLSVVDVIKIVVRIKWRQHKNVKNAGTANVVFSHVVGIFSEHTGTASHVLHLCLLRVGSLTVLNRCLTKSERGTKSTRGQCKMCTNSFTAPHALARDTSTWGEPYAFGLNARRAISAWAASKSETMSVVRR
ncbi:unnamed protein product [Ectocarpus sp. 4 AP-2014]